MLTGGARWAVDRGYGTAADLERIEEHGCMAGAKPDEVSDHAKNRQRDEMGTLGSGNHYLEVQQVAKVFDPAVAAAFQLREGDIVVSIHCGSRGLGHQIGTEFLKRMALAAPTYGIDVPGSRAGVRADRLAARAGVSRRDARGASTARSRIARSSRISCGGPSRRSCPRAELTLLYDVSHNTCKVESHQVNGRTKRLFVHRKGATRAFGPGHPDLPPAFASIGQPVLIGGHDGHGVVRAGRHG